MPKCTINGQEVEVKEGTTVIEAFKQVEQDIAHYCWHPGLSIAGVCRLCMIEVEGNPRLQIACNTVVQDGMVVTNQSEKVKDTVRWGMDFHLINHPLDCPICDQAGECGLQEQYMKYGNYDPEMAERKVKKRKVVDLGPKIVLDSERCILCSRCVRFCEEVTETNELGIFNRGDRSEIGTFDDKPLDNNYSVNTVDICPVGALTSKDFRFRQRVWYLESAETICTGCSTGCNVKVYYNEEGLWRVKPTHNEDVNGHWMCDEGRDVYKFVNRKERLLRGRHGHSGQWKMADSKEATMAAGRRVRELANKNGSDSVALVLTGQYTNEEYRDVMELFVGQLESKNVYHWMNNPEKADEFDGLLLRGDRNPNTKGLQEAMRSNGVSNNWADLESKINSGTIQAVIVAGPENQSHFPTFKEKVELLAKASCLVWFTACKNEALDSVGTEMWQLPAKSYAEKAGSYTNHSGKVQEVEAVTTIVPGALSLSEAARLMAGEAVNLETTDDMATRLKQNRFSDEDFYEHS